MVSDFETTNTIGVYSHLNTYIKCLVSRHLPMAGGFTCLLVSRHLAMAGGFTGLFVTRHLPMAGGFTGLFVTRHGNGQRFHRSVRYQTRQWPAVSPVCSLPDTYPWPAVSPVCSLPDTFPWPAVSPVS